MMRWLAILLACAASCAQAQLYPLGSNVGTLQVPYNTGNDWGALSISGSGSICMTVSCSMTTPALGVPASGDFSTGTFTWPTFNQGTTGNAATATNLASYPTLCSGGQFSQGLSSGSNNCGTPSGGGAVATILETSKTATISETVLCNDTSGLCNVAGAQYQVSWNIWGSGTACSSVTAGEVTLALYWTDENGIAHSGVIMLMQTQTAATTIASDAYFHFETALANESSSGTFNLSSNGAAPIEFGQVYTACTTGTGTYNTRIAVTRLQ